jgi:hypothetical protein
MLALVNNTKIRIALATCVIVALSLTTALIVINNPTSNGDNLDSGSQTGDSGLGYQLPVQPRASKFFFRPGDQHDGILRLSIDSQPNTNFLDIDEQNAIIKCEVVGNSILVDLFPFKITPLETGLTNIRITAIMSDGELKTQTGIVLVYDKDTNADSGQMPDQTNTDCSLELHATVSTNSISLVLKNGDTEITDMAVTVKVISGQISFTGQFINTFSFTKSGEAPFVVSFTASSENNPAVELLLVL